MALLIFQCASYGNRAWGQAAASLRGTVTDPTAGAVPGAMIVLTDMASKTVRTATADDQGEYQFLFLSPGTYTLTITAIRTDGVTVVS
jgi:hypothetical protein